MTERCKYQGIYASQAHATYGHSNHGARVIDMVAGWEWDSLVDVGCGWNEFAKCLRTRHPTRTVVGIDFACPGADINADVTQGLPWASKRFDVLTAFDMLEHLQENDVPAVLAEFARISRRFVFSISHIPSLNTWQGENLHPTVRPPEWWQSMIQAAGGSVVRTTAGYWIGEWQKPVANMRDLGKSWCLVGNGPSILRTDGALIDSHDVIIRLNNYVTRAHERNTGAKTTVWGWAGNGMRPEGIVAFGLRIHGTPTESPPQVFDVPVSFYQSLRAELQATAANADLLASCGYVAARWILDNGIANHLTLAGFDHFSRQTSQQHHYWQPGSFKAPKEHDGTAEAAELSRLHSSRITYLSPLHASS